MIETNVSENMEEMEKPLHPTAILDWKIQSRTDIGEISYIWDFLSPPTLIVSLVCENNENGKLLIIRHAIPDCISSLGSPVG